MSNAMSELKIKWIGITFIVITNISVCQQALEKVEDIQTRSAVNELAILYRIPSNSKSSNPYDFSSQSVETGGIFQLNG